MHISSHHYRADWQCLFPSLKCFTHCLTLLECMQEFPLAQWSCVWISSVGISSFQEILSLQAEEGWKKCPHQSFSCTEIWPHKGRVMWFFLPVWDNKMELLNIYSTLQYCQALVCNLTTLKTLSTTFIHVFGKSHSTAQGLLWFCTHRFVAVFFSPFLVVECTQQQKSRNKHTTNQKK